jgi:hypothetical protein
MSRQSDLIGLADNGTTLESVSSAYNAGALSNRNLVINGAMQVWQRATSVNGGSIGGFVWLADRFWLYGPSTSSGTVSQSTDVPSNQGFTYSIYNNCDAGCNIGTNVELPTTGSAGLFHSGQTFTLSFWVKGTSVVTSQTISCSFRDNAGGAGNVPLASGTSFDISTSWNRVQVPITIDATPAGTNKAFQFEFTMPAGTKVTGVQLEVGTVATPFEHRSYGQELALCQRYFYKKVAGDIRMFSSNDGTPYRQSYFYFPVEMRATPSASGYLSTHGSINNFNTTQQYAGVEVSGVSSTQAVDFYGTPSYDAEL